jgi:hypothetical protein
MTIKNFQDALSFYSFARMMKYDLPDGQWEDLKDIVSCYVEDYGKDAEKWPEDAKETFADEVRENYNYWM